MPNSGEAQPFSWKRAAVYVAVPFAAALASAVVAVLVTEIDDPGKVGEETGRLMVPGLLLALLASYLIQSGRRISAWICAALALFVFAGSVAVPILKRTRSHPIAVDALDTAPLEIVDIDGKPYFRHPYLRFAFAQPTPDFVAQPELQASTLAFYAQQDSVHAYALAASQSEATLVVIIAKANYFEREELEGFVAGASAFATDPAIQRLQEDVIWEPSFRGAKLHFVIADENHYRVYAQVGDYGTDAEYIVALVALSAGEDSLVDVLESFRGSVTDPRTP